MKSLITISNKKGFTLIETLVAIAILMISVAGPLVIANKALTSALYAKDQSTASYLAQEEMELIKNSRDNYIKLNPGKSVTDWINVSLCNAVTMHCDLTVVDTGNSISISPNCGSGGCSLLLGSSGYGHLSGSKTLFSRFFTLTRINDDDYQVTVEVDWNEGTVPNAVTLHSELVSALR